MESLHAKVALAIHLASSHASLFSTSWQLSLVTAFVHVIIFNSLCVLRVPLQKQDNKLISACPCPHGTVDHACSQKLHSCWPLLLSVFISTAAMHSIFQAATAHPSICLLSMHSSYSHPCQLPSLEQSLKLYVLV